MVRRSIPAVVALLLATTLAGCSADEPAAKPSPEPTPIGRLDVDGLRLVRAPFCDRVRDPAVRQALGGAAEGDQHWGNGDPVAGDEGSGDVGHELGCGWTGAGGASARAWVFARPVDATFAATLVRQAGQEQGCTVEPTRTFGVPAVLQTCTRPGGVQRSRRAGLFGDTWVTCEVSAPASPAVRSRLDAWCAAVVAALDTA